MLNSTTKLLQRHYLSQRLLPRIPLQYHINYFCSNNKSFLPTSIEPVLLNWYLAFLLNGTIETGILETIPKEESISIDDICNKCQTSMNITYKTLRFMSSMGYTKEIKHKYFIHTDKSLDLCKNGNAYYTFKQFMDIDLYPSRYRFDEYLRGKSFEEINGKSLLELLNKNPSKRENLSGILKEITMRANEPELIESHHFDFNDKNKYKKVIDLGGGIGELMYHLCNKYKHIDGYVFEQEKYIENAKQYWLHALKINIDNIDNLKFIKGDLLNQDDVNKYCKDCDVIIMKRVIHDYDDEKCAQILTNIRNAINIENHKKNIEDKVLLICDLALKDDLNDKSDLTEKLIDLEMGFVLNWKERRISQFDELFKNHGFQRIDGYPKQLANIDITAFKPCLQHIPSSFLSN